VRLDLRSEKLQEAAPLGKIKIQLPSSLTFALIQIEQNIKNF
jgi:hypothetical protein